MDNTTSELIQLYTYSLNNGLLQYLPQYHINLIQRLFALMNNQDYSDEYKAIRNRLYGIMLLLVNSSVSRSNTIEFCLTVIKDHPDITHLYKGLQDVIDSFDGWNTISNYDYNCVSDMLLKIMRLQVGRDTFYKKIAEIVMKYDPNNYHCNSLFGKVVDINIVDIVSKVYNK